MGAVTGVHRAGASLNVHVHFHLLCVDGVYVADADETLRFEPAPAPTRAELTSMLERIYARVMKWLARRGLLRNPDDAGASNAPPELSPAEALATAAMLQDVACRQRREYPHPVVLRGDRDRHPLAHRDPGRRRRATPPRSRAREQAQVPCPTRSTSRNRDPPRGPRGERGVRAPHRDDHGDLPGFGGGADARSAPSYAELRVDSRARSTSARGRMTG